MADPKARHKVDEDSPLLRLRRHDSAPASYGAIRFAGSKRMPSKWLGCSDACDISDVIDVVTETWDLPHPPVLISITGAAAADIHMKAKDRAVFERGLRNAASKTGAWIITGGTNSGVMKMVGQMVQKAGDDAPVCLGIAPLGCILHHEEMAAGGKGHIYHYPKEETKKGVPRAVLDPNHSHFVLVDDGTTGNFGGERNMRNAFEDRICQPIPDGACARSPRLCRRPAACVSRDAITQPTPLPAARAAARRCCLPRHPPRTHHAPPLSCLGCRRCQDG